MNHYYGKIKIMMHGPLSVEGSLASTIGQLNPFRYKGYYYDNESGMYYCNSRYYNPQWGRFLNSDSIEYLDPESINGLNLYCYCMNNPIMYANPSGHFGILATLLISTLVGTVSSVVTSLANGEKITAKSIISGAVGGAVAELIIGVSSGTAITAANYASAAAESLVNEMWDYTSSEKELTGDNILKSVGSCFPGLKTNSG